MAMAESPMSSSSTASNLFSVVGKNVLITGGSRGIGLMIGKGMAIHGANVLLTSRDPAACEKAVASIQKHTAGTSATTGSVNYVTSNVSTRQGCHELMQHVRRIYDGKLHVLINNAGTSWGEDPYYGDGGESGKMNWGWDKVLDLNVKGIFYLSRECVPLLAAASTPEDPARIINVGSIAGLVPQDAPTHAYDASKAAVHQLTKKMAADLCNRNITVNAVAPGFVETRMSAGLAKWGGSTEKLAAQIPLQRLGNEDDMAGACMFLSSRAGSWCTGVILPVDGGAVGAMQIPLSSL